MNKTPLFSILIANYNNTIYLIEAVNSIKSQTYKNWEIVIVDDASTDGLSHLYDQLTEDKRIKVYFNNSNRKTAFTFKRSLDYSMGELCGFLGPDDILHETAIEKAVKKHLENPEASLVYTLNYLCDENLKIIRIHPWGGVLPDEESQLTANPGQKITSFATFKKTFYNLTEGINPVFTRGFDQDFFYKMEEVGKVVCINEPLYFYRQHSNNISLNENNIKAWYWLYRANSDAYYRRKKKNFNIKNTTFGELQRLYLKVCLLKIDQKIRNRKFRNIEYYYAQSLIRLFWDSSFLFIKTHWFFLVRFGLYIFKGKELDRLYFK